MAFLPPADQGTQKTPSNPAGADGGGSFFIFFNGLRKISHKQNLNRVSSRNIGETGSNIGNPVQILLGVADFLKNNKI